MEDVPLGARKIVIRTEYVLALLDQGLAEMGTEKAGAAGDENLLAVHVGIFGPGIG